MHKAAKKGDIRWSELLLSRGADVNARDSFGFTALYWAAWNGEMDLFNLLVANNAEFDIKDSKGERDCRGERGRRGDKATNAGLLLNERKLVFISIDK